MLYLGIFIDTLYTSTMSQHRLLASYWSFLPIQLASDCLNFSFLSDIFLRNYEIARVATERIQKAR